MDKETKNLLLSIQSQVKEINNKVEKMESVSSNGNYVYTNEK